MYIHYIHIYIYIYIHTHAEVRESTRVVLGDIPKKGGAVFSRLLSLAVLVLCATPSPETTLLKHSPLLTPEATRNAQPNRLAVWQAWRSGFLSRLPGRRGSEGAQLGQEKST